MKPTVFAAVMATGIVSIAAADHGLGFLSCPLALLAIIALAVLMCLTVARWRSFDLRDIDTVVGLFAYVAACSVLAGRFAAYRPAVWVFGALALLGWLALVPVLLLRMRRLGWAGLCGRARGSWELVSVATSGLAIVFVAGGTMFWAFIFWVLALGLYGVMTTLIAWRALMEPGLRRNVPPDHWILLGGVAIATVAVAAVQIVPLAITGWRQLLDWPAVFPLGMFSAASYSVALETGWQSLVVVSHVFFGIAFAAWLAVVGILVRPVLRLISGHGLRPQ